MMPPYHRQTSILSGTRRGRPDGCSPDHLRPHLVICPHRTFGSVALIQQMQSPQRLAAVTDLTKYVQTQCGIDLTKV
jgi:hypothetical protein